MASFVRVPAIVGASLFAAAAACSLVDPLDGLVGNDVEEAGASSSGSSGSGPPDSGGPETLPAADGSIDGPMLPFCARLDPAPAFCADFDGTDVLPAPFDQALVLGTGKLVIDGTDARSMPRSLLLTAKGAAA